MVKLILIIIAVAIIFKVYNSIKQKALKEQQAEFERKRQLEELQKQKILKEQQVEFERKRQLEELQKQKALKEQQAEFERKRQLEELQKQKALKEQQAEFERKRQLEELQKQKALKEQQAEFERKRQLEELQKQKALKEQQAEFERKRQLEELQKQKALKEQQAEFERKRQLEELQKQKILKNKFIIYSNDYLKKNIEAFYHDDYHSGGNWRIDGTIENMIWTLKNDSSPFPLRLPNARERLKKILLIDLPPILKSTNFNSLTVCVVPRAKKESFYNDNQLYFRESVNEVVNKLQGFCNGITYIKRHTNTRTTHLRGDGGDGNLPYIGITKNTCIISNEVQNKDILLIDDIYTKSINIDEDVIQALLDNGANSVIFYSIGKTISKI